ncbi:MAG: galactose mutarotase [Planctomycetes bacterium]|nr:galactose mutarotase [Planctomycetota bacterium]
MRQVHKSKTRLGEWAGGAVLVLAAGFLAAGCEPQKAARDEAPALRPADVPRAQGLGMARQAFGTTPDGEAVELFTLDSGPGLRVSLINYGAILTAVEVPDRAGKTANVCLYVDTLEQYLKGVPSGAVIGRYANRIGGAKFSIDGAEYKVTANASPNHIHGGRRGFDKVVWKAEPVAGADWTGVRFSYTSPDGDEGYPGTVRATVTYAVTVNSELRMEYTATTDKPTVVNLTNHAYWNLAGAGQGNVYANQLMINADRYLPADAALIPSGELAKVEGTPLDFRTPHAVGARIAELPATRGYDHCYVLNKKSPAELSLAARVVEPVSGRAMEVWTTYPGVQLYTANHLDGKLKVAGRAYEKHGALCLETQYFPDSPNKPNFPSPMLRPGQTYRHVTVHKFSVEK